MIVSTMISGHRTLALLAEALEEEQAAEKADLFLDVSLFCADGDAMAGRPVRRCEQRLLHSSSCEQATRWPG